MGLTVDFTVEAGRITLRDARTGTAVLPGIYFVAEFGDGTLISTAGERADLQREGADRLHWPGSAQRPGLTLELSDVNHSAVTLQLRLHNTTGAPVVLETLSPMVCDEVALGTPPEQFLFYRTGWQSWSPTGATRVSDDQLPAGPPVVAPIIRAPHDSGLSSAWAAAVRGEGGATLMVGFTTAFNQLSTVRLTEDGELWASCHLEGIAVDPGAEAISELLFVDFGNDEVDLLQTYAAETALRMGARRSQSLAAGWCSWYQYFAQVCEEDVLQNLEYLKDGDRDREIQVVQLDDGYQADFGDWLLLNDKFPHGLAWLVEQIKQAGFIPGLWLAPFAVSPDSTLYHQHPDWVIRREDGEPLQTWAGFDWDRQLYGLDCSNPEARAWLRHVFQTIIHEWGFEYLKLDFLCCGALRGIRFDLGATSVQAYREGLSLIRDIAGDRYLLGCGAPLLPAVGLVDGMRVGCDIAPFWESDEQDEYKAWPAASNAIRNTIARYWMHNHFWQNDPDCLIVRESDNQLTEAEVQTWATLVGLSGGLIVLSDALPDLGEERLQLIDRVLPQYGKSATPRDLFATELPCMLVLEVVQPYETWHVVGLFNWESVDAQTTFELTDLMDPGDWHVYDFWEQTYLGIVREKLTLELQPHGCRLLAVRRLTDHPQLVGSTFHFTQGGVEVLDHRWDGSTLAVELHTLSERRGQLVFAWPQNYRLSKIDDQLTGLRSQVGDRLLTVEFSLNGTAWLNLIFETEGTAG